MLQDIVDGFRRESAEDYVGLWQISRAVKELSGPSQAEKIVVVVAALLEDGDIAVGQFKEGQFVEWIGSREEHLGRIHRELLQLGADPDIGDVAWLVKRSD